MDIQFSSEGPWTDDRIFSGARIIQPMSLVHWIEEDGAGFCDGGEVGRDHGYIGDGADNLSIFFPYDISSWLTVDSTC